MEKKDHLKWWDNNLDKRENEFSDWLLSSDNDSRNYLYDFLINNDNIIDVLECGPGTFIDYELFFKDNVKKNYESIDITDNIVETGLNKNINIVLSSIENIQKESNEYDLVYCRHVLEHQDFFKDSINEMIRVSKKYIIIIFWLLSGDETIIKYDKEQCIYHNIYSKTEIENFLFEKNMKFNWWFGKNDKILIIEKKTDNK